jgi:HAD superfamily hydrolase (TIGR01484 family)
VLPWDDVPLDELSQVVGVLTDIDDTLTADGRIEDAALEALGQLNRAGVPVIAITGRPQGWSEPFAREWPLAAIVAENGAVSLRKRAKPNDGLQIDYVQDAFTRENNARRLREVAQRILQEVPGATLAQDSAGRVTDIAVDHSEFAHLGQAAIEQVVSIMRAQGMNATVSSIHINGWFGDHTKLSGARWIVQSVLGRALDPECDRWIYVGDSTNDQLMFGHFSLSVGVANLMDFAQRLHTWPRFITRSARGRGFAEVSERLLLARQR